MDDGFQMEFFGGQTRETLFQIKTHLVPENTDGTRTCAVFFPYSLVEYPPEQV